MLLARMRTTALEWSRQWGLVVVRGRSMQPTLRDGDRLLVRHGGVPCAGRVLVVRLPNGVLAVKRASYLEEQGWWVERDNPQEGVDSWQVGAIPERDVLAVAVLRIWPRPARVSRGSHTSRGLLRRRHRGTGRG